MALSYRKGGRKVCCCLRVLGLAVGWWVAGFLYAALQCCWHAVSAGVHSCNCPCFIQARGGGCQQLFAKHAPAPTNLSTPACALTAAAAALPTATQTAEYGARAGHAGHTSRGAAAAVRNGLLAGGCAGGAQAHIRAAVQTGLQGHHHAGERRLCACLRERARTHACMCRSPCLLVCRAPAACGTLCLRLLWPVSCWQFKLVGSHTLSRVL